MKRLSWSTKTEIKLNKSRYMNKNKYKIKAQDIDNYCTVLYY